jgi:predicted transcriptional regulator
MNRSQPPSLNQTVSQHHLYLERHSRQSSASIAGMATHTDRDLTSGPKCGHNGDMKKWDEIKVRIDPEVDPGLKYRAELLAAEMRISLSCLVTAAIRYTVSQAAREAEKRKAAAGKVKP